MRLGQMVRAWIVTCTMLAVVAVLPLAVAADAPPKPDLRFLITRLGVPDVTPVAPPPATTPTVSNVTSFRFTAQGKITVTGTKDTVTLAMKGEFAMPSNLRATVTLSDSGSTQQLAPFEVVVIGTTPYVHLTGSNAPNGKDLWVLIDNPNSTHGMPTAMLPNFANLPPISTQTQTIGDETINGTLTTHMRTTVDATKILGGSAPGAKPSTLTLDLWTGKSDNFPRHLTINGTLAIDPSTVANLVGNSSSTSVADIPPVDLTLTFSMDFTDLNAPVTVTAPTSFVKLSDLLNQ